MLMQQHQHKTRSRFRCMIRTLDAHDELGMTLIEIMVVVAIISLIMGSVGVVAYQKFKKASLANTKQIIVTVKNALTEYAMDTTDPCPKDLNELKEKKYLNKDPVDAWGQPLMYKCPGDHDKDTADVSSKGPDKQEGTDDDITSWEEDQAEE